MPQPSLFARSGGDVLLVSELAVAIAINGHRVVKLNDPIVVQPPKFVKHFGCSILVVKAHNNKIVHDKSPNLNGTIGRLI